MGNKTLFILGFLIVLILLAVYQIVTGGESDKTRAEMFTAVDPGEEITKTRLQQDTSNTYILEHKRSAAGRKFNQLRVLWHKLLRFDFSKRVRYLPEKGYSNVPTDQLTVENILARMRSNDTVQRRKRRHVMTEPFDILDVESLFNDKLRREFSAFPQWYVHDMFYVMLTYWRDASLDSSRDVLTLCKHKVPANFFKFYMKKHVYESVHTYKHLPVKDIIGLYRKYRQRKKSKQS
ncbi:MAG TPA: hypothetical protein VKS21_13325 [Spirochaetota bacterium]|nr:hypothetical protein [Spirochaetota bacterium]